MDDLDDGLLGIAISDDEKVDDSGADTTAPGRNGSSDAAAPAATARADRNALSEEDYQVVKKEYRARMENGEVRHRWHACPLSLFFSVIDRQSWRGYRGGVGKRSCLLTVRPRSGRR